MPYWVYILANRRDGTLYVGLTSDLVRRMAEHREQVADGFTRKYRVDRLVHVEEFQDVLEARTREARLKRWRRDWKTILIEEGNPNWEDLSEKLGI